MLGILVVLQFMYNKNNKVYSVGICSCSKLCFYLFLLSENSFNIDEGKGQAFI